MHIYIHLQNTYLSSKKRRENLQNKQNLYNKIHVFIKLKSENKNGSKCDREKKRTEHYHTSKLFSVTNQQPLKQNMYISFPTWAR